MRSMGIRAAPERPAIRVRFGCNDGVSSFGLSGPSEARMEARLRELGASKLPCQFLRGTASSESTYENGSRLAAGAAFALFALPTIAVLPNSDVRPTLPMKSRLFNLFTSTNPGRYGNRAELAHKPAARMRAFAPTASLAT